MTGPFGRRQADDSKPATNPLPAASAAGSSPSTSLYLKIALGVGLGLAAAWFWPTSHEAPNAGAPELVAAAPLAPVQAYDGGYLKAPVELPRPGDRCKYTALKVTAEGGGVARSISSQYCPSTGTWYTDTRYDCGHARRWVEGSAENVAGLAGTRRDSDWSYLVEGSSATIIGRHACKSIGLTLRSPS